MDNFKASGTWSLKQLDKEIFEKLGFNEESLYVTNTFINALLDESVTPEKRFDALIGLDKALGGNNARHRLPALVMLAGSAEFQAAASNGCGPQWLENTLGIKFPDGSWRICCDEHDECYNQGGGILGKLICDLKFYDCLTRHSYLIVAELYFIGVLVFGWFSHRWGATGHPTPPEPPPQPTCSGTCVGIQTVYTNLRNYKLWLPKQDGFGWNAVSARITQDGRERLGQEAERLEGVEMERECESGCRCQWMSHGEWERKDATIVVPTVDGVERGTRWSCTASQWERQVIGNCVEE